MIYSSVAGLSSGGHQRMDHTMFQDFLYPRQSVVCVSQMIDQMSDLGASFTRAFFVETFRKKNEY